MTSRGEYAVRWTIQLLCVAVFAALGCGETTEPEDELVLTMQNMAGIYYGVTFTTEESGVVTDQLRLGATIELFLFPSGDTEGRLFIPAGACCEQDLSLNGSWALSGNIVTLDFAADSFLDGMSLEFEETHLTGETVRDGVIYRVVLAL